MSQIHQTAVIDPKAQLGTNVEIGPYCVIGPHVEIGDNVRIKSHVVIDGHTSIGKGCEIFPFASLGHAPQHFKYEGEPSQLLIGEGNIIREHCQMHPGTKIGGMKTVIGNNGLFMASSHVGHDCIIGDNMILAQNAALGGHVEVGDNVYFGAFSAAHQFVRIGHDAVIGGVTAVVGDVIPFGAVYGERGALNGVNLVGMKRRGLGRETRQAIKQAYDLIFMGDGLFEDRLQEAKNTMASSDEVAHIIDFIEGVSGRPLCLAKQDKS